MDIDDINNIQDIQDLDESELLDLLDNIKMLPDDEVITNDTEDDISIDNCIKCKTNEYLVEDVSKGIIVCSGCGLILDEIIDASPEWRSYSDSRRQVNGRCSRPINPHLPQSSLGTSIRGISYYSPIRRLQRWNYMSYRERSLNEVLKYIQSICRKYNILKCIEDDAKILFKNFKNCKHKTGKSKGRYIILRGINKAGLIAACVFFACKRKRVTRSPKEIARIFNIKVFELTKGCNLFLKLLRIHNMSYECIPSKSNHYIRRYCRQLSIKNKEYINQSIQIANNINKLNIADDHTSLSVATGSILIMANLNNLDIPRKKLTDRFEVTEVTIKKVYDRLLPWKYILINDDKCDYLAKKQQEKKQESNVPYALMKRYQNIEENDSDYNDKFSIRVYMDSQIINDYLQDNIDDDILEITNNL
jgi:transcription initiation factor TFIIIB Brf1 subunit/transcription initiation factor TFIIB